MFQSLEELLNLSKDWHRTEMDDLLALSEELKTNPEKCLRVDSIHLQKHTFSDRSTWELSLHFRWRQDGALWKACLTSALNKLGISDFSTIAQDHRYRYPGFKTSLTLQELKSILGYLKPLASRSHFETVDFHEESVDVVRLYASFFDGVSVRKAEFDFFDRFGSKNKTLPRKVDLSVWCRLVRAMKPLDITLFSGVGCYTPNVIKFLLASADVVERISMGCYDEKKGAVLKLDFIKEIMKRKCSYFHFGDETTKYSQTEVEELVQASILYLQELGRKVSLAIPTDGSVVDGRIGQFNVKTGFRNKCSHRKDLLLIEHFEMTPKAEEEEMIIELNKQYDAWEKEELNAVKDGEQDSDEEEEKEAMFELKDILISDSDMSDDSDEEAIAGVQPNSLEEASSPEFDQENDSESDSEPLTSSREHIANKEFNVKSNEEAELHAILDYSCHQQSLHADILLQFQCESTTGRQLTIEKLEVRQDTRDKLKFIKLHFILASSFDQTVLVTCAAAILDKLGISDNCLSVCRFKNDEEAFELELRLQPEDLRNMIPYLKPIIDRMHMNKMAIEDDSSDVIILTADFMEGATVQTFYIDLELIRICTRKTRKELENYGPWVTFIRKVRPSALSYTRYMLTEDLTEFLMQSAEVVNVMYIGKTRKSPANGSLPPSLIKEILRRNCSYLTSWDHRDSSLSLAQVEDLVQSFHSFSKKVSLACRTDEVPFNQMGEYTISFPPAMGFLRDALVIEHAEMGQKHEDVCVKGWYDD